MTTYPHYKIITIAAAACIAAMVLPGCHHADDAPEKDTKFEVTAGLLNSLLKDTVKEASALTQITLTGSIAPDETKMVKIFPLVSGVAEDVKVQLGDVGAKRTNGCYFKKRRNGRGLPKITFHQTRM